MFYKQTTINEKEWKYKGYQQLIKPYEAPEWTTKDTIFQYVKKGIGIYTENMRQYKWIIQKLLSN